MIIDVYFRSTSYNGAKCPTATCCGHLLSLIVLLYQGVTSMATNRDKAKPEFKRILK